MTKLSKVEGRGTNRRVVGFLVADLNDGEGDVFFDQWFLHETGSILKKDVLKDMIGVLERMYDDIDLSNQEG